MYNRFVGKTFYFLAGLHRSGNTVLSSILNQHPDIYSSPISALIEHMWTCHVTTEDFESTNVNLDDKKRSINLISNMPNIYYDDIDKPVILDRNKSWINQANIDVLKRYVKKDPKIIFTTRPFLDCAASIAIDKPTVIRTMNQSNFIQDSKLKENENAVDFLFSEHSPFGRTRNFAMQSIDNKDNDNFIHIVKYEDLLNYPQETMDKIYDFLELEKFKHNFKNIIRLEKYNDTARGFSKDLHKVRKVLGKGSVKVEELLTPYTIEKYKDVRYF
jgi:hypothetical protein